MLNESKMISISSKQSNRIWIIGGNNSHVYELCISDEPIHVLQMNILKQLHGINQHKQDQQEKQTQALITIITK